MTLARAHLWLKALTDGTYRSIEEVANIAKWNPKVVRKVLRLAFLAPDITEAIIIGSQPSSLSTSELQGIAALSWDEQRRLLRFPTATQRADTAGRRRREAVRVDNCTDFLSENCT